VTTLRDAALSRKSRRSTIVVVITKGK